MVLRVKITHQRRVAEWKNLITLARVASFIFDAGNAKIKKCVAGNLFEYRTCRARQSVVGVTVLF